MRMNGKYPLTNEQNNAVDLAITGQSLKVEAYAGAGKCLGRDTPVMLHDGSIKAVQDVVEGDVLMGWDSTPRRVLSTTSGLDALYRITPVKGDAWVCNSRHILTLVGTNNHNGEIRDVCISDFLEETKELYTKSGRVDKNWKQFRVPVSFDHIDTDFDPYFLGVWLGDGTRGKAAITSKDQIIIDHVSSVAEKYGLNSRQVKEKSNCYRVEFTNRSNLGFKGSNHIRECVRPFDDEKFVPETYKYNSLDVRLKVLSGLIDTDGSVSRGGYDFVTKYKRLADDVVFLARSVGLSAYMNIKSVKLNGWTESRDYHRISISGDCSIIPCLLKKAPKRKQCKDNLRTGFTIESIGVGEYFGFEITGDGRFLLGDFTVTHNTSTLQAIARELPGRGAYIAFNKSIADEAGRKFTPNVRASTAHSLAYRAVGALYRDRLQTRLTGRMVALAINLRDWQILPPTESALAQTLTAAQQGYLLIEFVTRFCNTDDDHISIQHAPLGSLIVKSPDIATNRAVKQQVFSQLLPLAQTLWAMLINRNGKLPITHDTYLKLWALGEPDLGMDFVLFDEAQDASGVMLGVLQKQTAQVIWVGDRFQQIYSWRGAVNAMQTIQTTHTASITQSFRFGAEIASLAAAVMQHQLRVDMPIKGFEPILSRISFDQLDAPKAILCRTNAQCVGNLADNIATGKRVAIVGDVQGMIDTVYGISSLMGGVKPERGELSVFDSWQELQEYMDSGLGGDLVPLTNLIRDHGASKLRGWLYAARDTREDEADIYISTAHRSKGREWSTVRLADDFLQPTDAGWAEEAANLLYVAVTRAQHVLDVSACTAVQAAMRSAVSMAA